MAVSILPTITALQFIYLDFIGESTSQAEVRRYIKSLKPMTNQAAYSIGQTLKRKGLIEIEGDTSGSVVTITAIGVEAMVEYREHCKQVLGR